MKPTKISIVSPVYRGEKMLVKLVERISASVSKITPDYEIILVNDCSPDNSWSVIKHICHNNEHVKGIDLSRNFGQHPAISAGLRNATGDWVVVMDCDLQDRPEEIENLYNKALEGYEVVFARRAVRKDGYLKRMSSTVFHKVYDWLSNTKSDETVANFGIYKDIVIREIVNIPDQSRLFFTLLNHVGFKTAYVDVEHSEREEGKSSYTIFKLLKLAFDGIVANSNRPLKFAVGLGFTMSLVSFLLAMYNVFAKLAGIIKVAGFTTTVFSIWFVGGLILLVLGVVGLYIGRIYDQVKGRPYVVIRERLNF